MEKFESKVSTRKMKNDEKYCFSIIDPIKWVTSIDVYDNDKLLILVGKHESSNLIIKFNRYRYVVHF